MSWAKFRLMCPRRSSVRLRLVSPRWSAVRLRFVSPRWNSVRLHFHSFSSFLSFVSAHILIMSNEVVGEILSNFPQKISIWRYSHHLCPYNLLYLFIRLHKFIDFYSVICQTLRFFFTFFLLLFCSYVGHFILIQIVCDKPKIVIKKTTKYKQKINEIFRVLLQEALNSTYTPPLNIQLNTFRNSRK